MQDEHTKKKSSKLAEHIDDFRQARVRAGPKGPRVFWASSRRCVCVRVCVRERGVWVGGWVGGWVYAYAYAYAYML